MVQLRQLKAFRPRRTTSPTVLANLTEPPLGAVLAVEREVGRAFEAWARAALEELQPLIEFRFGRNRAVRADSVWSAFLKALDPRVNGSVLDKSWSELDGKSKRAVKRVAGVAVADVLPEGEQLRQEWLREATDLIKGTDLFREKVRAIIEDPLNAGVRPEKIAKMLEKQLGISKRRAELIARDQTLKAYGRLQQARQQRAGIKRYRWRTSRDERVRHRHRDLDNTIQSWDKPPIVHPSGRRAHPGQDFQCRCSSAPVVDEEVNAPRPTPGLVEPDLELSQFVSVSLPTAPDRGPRQRPRRAAPAPAPAVRQPRASAADNFQAAGFAVDDAPSLNDGVRQVFGRKRPTPKDLGNVLGNLPIEGKAGVIVGRGDIRIVAQLEGGGRIARRFARDEANKLVAEHLEFYLEGLRGKGVGKAALAAQVRAYKRLGVDRIELHAQAEGRAVWPKLGFRLKYPEALESAKAAFQASTGADVSAIKSIEDLARAPGGSDWLQTANGPWNYLELKI